MVNAMDINMVAPKKVIPSTKIMHIYSYKLPRFNLGFSKLPTLPNSLVCNAAKFKVSDTICSSPKILSENQENGTEEEVEFQDKFDWYAEWYPVVHVCDLDESRPIRRRIMGLDILVSWDEVEKNWKVFEDERPQSSHSKDVPLEDHGFKRASVALYPSCVQDEILWFWPNTEGIVLEKRPPQIPEIGGLPASKLNYSRDLPYGYEVLIQNLMDPAHIPYVHYNIMGSFLSHESVKADKEGGKPLEMNVKELTINGFKAKLEFEGSVGTFSPPCLFYISTNHSKTPNNVQSYDTEKRYLMIFYCIPVSPGYSRLIVTTRRNFALWLDPVVPLWIFHQELNLVLDSDLYLIHMEERKLMNVGPLTWHKSCYVPTKADAVVVAFRRWLIRYGGGQIQWGAKFRGVLPPTPPREQFFDRYWTHTMNCKSCRLAYKSMNALEILLRVTSIAVLGMMFAAGNNNMISTAARRSGAVSLVVILFIASKWLSVLAYKTFRYHDYNHASIKAHPFSFVIQQLQSYVGL